MININFVPEDYVQNNESRRTNLLYLALFVVVMAGLSGAFLTIRMRQRALVAKEEQVNQKMAQAQEAIEQFEQLQARRKTMMKTALTTAELIEPMPRSVLLASLTNNLPVGVSLLRLNLIQKEPKKKSASARTSKYKNAQNKKQNENATQLSFEKSLEMHIAIEGFAPSDLQVAAYIERLGNSTLFENVALVESKEKKIEDVIFRQFKLTAMLVKDIHLTKQEMNNVKTQYDSSRVAF